MCQIINLRTNRVLATCDDKNAARDIQDRKDNADVACVHQISEAVTGLAVF